MSENEINYCTRQYLCDDKINQNFSMLCIYICSMSCTSENVMIIRNEKWKEKESKEWEKKWKTRQ